MPIKPILLQRRHAELGRIRLGHKATTQSGGTRPAKLDRFRFTSVSETYIRDLASLYGGDPKPWDNQGVSSWEVITTATSIPVIAVKGGLSQWLELWSGGGCIHRCDGETNVLTGEPCDHDEQVQVGRKKINPHAEAKPTTRLSVMLPELDAIGVWRLESHGWNAAAEIPAVAELAQFVGELVPARLVLQERRAVRDGETSRFVVPVLDLQIGAAKLREVVAAKMDGAGQLESGSSGPAPAALESGSGGDQPSVSDQGQQLQIPTPQQIAEADLDTARRMLAWLEAEVGEHPATAAARTRVEALSQPGSGQPDAEGVYDAEVVETPETGIQQPPSSPPGDGDAAEADALWQQILTRAGSQGMTTADLEDDFASRMGGVTSDSASVAELRHYLGLITTEEGAA